MINENCFFFPKIILNFFFVFKIDNTVTLNPDPNPDPNWAKILDPDPNSMYLDPQHWFCKTKFDVLKEKSILLKNYKNKCHQMKVSILSYIYMCVSNTDPDPQSS